MLICADYQTVLSLLGVVQSFSMDVTDCAVNVHAVCSLEFDWGRVWNVDKHHFCLLLTYLKSNLLCIRAYAYVYVGESAIKAPNQIAKTRSSSMKDNV